MKVYVDDNTGKSYVRIDGKLRELTGEKQQVKKKRPPRFVFVDKSTGKKYKKISDHVYEPYPED